MAFRLVGDFLKAAPRTKQPWLQDYYNEYYRIMGPFRSLLGPKNSPKLPLSVSPLALNADVYFRIRLSQKYNVIIEGAEKEHLQQLEAILSRLSPKLVSEARIVFMEHKDFFSQVRKLSSTAKERSNGWISKNVKVIQHRGNLFLPSWRAIDEGEFIHKLGDVYQFRHLKPPDKETELTILSNYSLPSKIQSSFSVQGDKVLGSCTTQDICIDYNTMRNRVSIHLPQGAPGGEAVLALFMKRRSDKSKDEVWELRETTREEKTLEIPMEDFENPVHNFAGILGIHTDELKKMCHAFGYVPDQQVIRQGGELFYLWRQAKGNISQKIKLLKDKKLIPAGLYKKIIESKTVKQKPERPRYRAQSASIALEFCNILYLCYQRPDYLMWLINFH